MLQDDLELLCFGGFWFIFRIVVDLSNPHFGCHLVCIFCVLFLPGIIQYCCFIILWFPTCDVWIVVAKTPRKNMDKKTEQSRSEDDLPDPFFTRSLMVFRISNY